MATLVYLDRNNRRITVSDDDAFEFVLRVASREGEFARKADAVVTAIARWIKSHCQPGLQKPSMMKTLDSLAKCRQAGCRVKKSGQGQSWIVHNTDNKSIRIGCGSRKLDGSVVRSYVKKLGLTEASTGAHLDEFQAVISPEQELIRKFRNVLNRLADA